MGDCCIRFSDFVKEERREHKPHRAVSISYSRYGKSTEIEKKKDDKSKKSYIEQEIYSFPKQGCWSKFMKIKNSLCYHKVKRSDSLNLSRKVESQCRPSKYIRKSNDEQSTRLESLSATSSAFNTHSGAPLMRNQSTFTNHTFITETESTNGSYMYVFKESKYSEF